MGLCDPGWLVGTCIAYQCEGRARAKRDWARHAKSLHCTNNWSTVHRCFVLKCNEYDSPNIYRNDRDKRLYTFNYPGLAIYDDEVMVSFDVVPLFTAISVDKACCYIEKKLEDDSFLHSRKKLDIKDICSLRHVVVSNKYFMFNGIIYKKIPAAPWLVLLALLLLSCVWKRRSKNQQFLPQLLLQHYGNASLTIAFALLIKMKSQSSTTY